MASIKLRLNNVEDPFNMYNMQIIESPEGINKTERKIKEIK